MNSTEFDENAPYALKSEEERARRLAMLDQAHIAPLVSHINEIENDRGPDCQIPFFDPCDGGIQAKALFLLESADNKAIASGFVSRNNRNQSAKNMLLLLQDAGFERNDTLLWNIVPWYLGGAPKLHEIIDALPYLKSLIAMLADLRVVVLVGIETSNMAPHMAKFTSVPIITSHYPSLENFNSIPAMKEQVQAHFIEAANLVYG